jgi:hypothetical protein
MTIKTLKILASGATAPSIEQGCAAAQEVFEAAGITPWQAALAAFDRDGWEINGFQDSEPSHEMFTHAEVWEAAEAAARDALSADGTSYSDFDMTVIDDEPC